MGTQPCSFSIFLLSLIILVIFVSTSNSYPIYPRTRPLFNASNRAQILSVNDLSQPSSTNSAAPPVPTTDDNQSPLVTHASMISTHNTASSYLDLSVITDYVRCQNTTIAQQLNCGIKTLVLTLLQQQDNSIWLSHGAFKTNLSLPAFLDELLIWARKNPTETIFLHFRLCQGDLCLQLTESIMNAYGFTWYRTGYNCFDPQLTLAALHNQTSIPAFSSPPVLPSIFHSAQITNAVKTYAFGDAIPRAGLVFLEAKCVNENFRPTVECYGDLNSLSVQSESNQMIGTTIDRNHGENEADHDEVILTPSQRPHTAIVSAIQHTVSDWLSTTYPNHAALANHSIKRAKPSNLNPFFYETTLLTSTDPLWASPQFYQLRKSLLTQLLHENMAKTAHLLQARQSHPLLAFLQSSEQTAYRLPQLHPVLELLARFIAISQGKMQMQLTAVRSMLHSTLHNLKTGSHYLSAMLINTNTSDAQTVQFSIDLGEQLGVVVNDLLEQFTHVESQYLDVSNVIESTLTALQRQDNTSNQQNDNDSNNGVLSSLDLYSKCIIGQSAEYLGCTNADCPGFNDESNYMAVKFAKRFPSLLSSCLSNTIIPTYQPLDNDHDGLGVIANRLYFEQEMKLSGIESLFSSLQSSLYDSSAMDIARSSWGIRGIWDEKLSMTTFRNHFDLALLKFHIDSLRDALDRDISTFITKINNVNSVPPRNTTSTPKPTTTPPPHPAPTSSCASNTNTPISTPNEVQYDCTAITDPTLSQYPFGMLDKYIIDMMRNLNTIIPSSSSTASTRSNQFSPSQPTVRINPHSSHSPSNPHPAASPYTLFTTQGHWQYSTTSVIIGTLKGSNIIKDNVFSQENHFVFENACGSPLIPPSSHPVSSLNRQNNQDRQDDQEQVLMIKYDKFRILQLDNVCHATTYNPHTKQYDVEAFMQCWGK